MIGKNNKKLKDLKQGVKVESYSIKKFKFGAASIVIGASIFFGTGVASANEVAASSDSSATNDTNATSGNGDKIPEKINTVSAEKENVASVNKPSSVKEESTKVEVEKKVVDKSLLETSITKLEELLATVNKDKAPASTLSAVNVDLINAKSILENANASQEEVDALVKKLKQQTQIVSSMPKVTTKEKEVKEGANTIANSGSRDSRNGKSMGEGTSFRANGEINQGALTNVKYFASVDPKDNGGRKTINDNPEFTRNKTDIKAYYMKDSEGQWIVYDVFFNNDGKKMTRYSYQQEYYFQGPFNIMDLTSDGLYKPNTVKDLYFTRYAPKDPNSGKKLSDGFDAFTPYGNTANISKFWDQNYNIFNADNRTIYDPRSGVYRENQRWDVFKHNQNDSTLNTLTKNKNGGYPGASYYLGLKVGSESTNYAVHMHAKIKIRDNVTPQEAAQYGRVYAATTTKGDTTQQSYIMGATGSRLQNDPEAPKDPIKGLTVTKTVGDDAGDPINPVSSGYVTHKNGKSFPAGMNWTWKDNKSPSTAEAGVFKYKSIATYKDGSSSEDKNSGSDGTVTLNVKPKQPIITPNLEHKKGLPNQQITVNVGNGVPNNSKVNIYDGDRIIGTGTTNGQTATVTVKEPLPGKPLKAETVVTNNNGTVTSDKSNPVTPTPKPDTQAPTLDVTPPEQVVKVGEKISFNVDGRDDTKVNLDFSDIFKKYPSHLFTQKTNYSVNTDKQKTLSIDLGEAKESDIGEKIVSFKATDDANHEIVKTVKVKVIPATKENEKHNPTAETVEIGIKQELTDEAIKAKVKNYPSNATLTVKQKPDTDTTGNKTATVIVTYSDKSTDEVTVPVVVRDTTPPKIYWVKDDGSKVELGKTHAEGQNIVIPLYRGDEVNTRLITTDDSGKVTNFKMENLQSGFNFTPVSGTATEGSPLGQNVTGKVGLSVAKGKYTARAISTDGTNSTTGHFVFEVHEQAEKYTPAANTLTVPFNHKITDDEVKGKVIAKPGTPAFPDGTIFEVVSKPETNTTGTDKKAVVKITYPDKSTENIDVPVHVGKDLASQHPLEGQTVTVTVGDSLKTWRGRVDSNQYTNAPKGRGNGVEWGWKGTTPKVVQDTAGVFKYTATATHTDKSVAESNPQVTVIVKPKAPTIETDLTGKAELPNTAVVVNVHEGVKNGSIVTLYSQDGRAIGRGTVTNGKATITGTIPKGNITAKTTVQTPGEQDVTSDPSPEKVATTNKAGIYPIKGKTATVTVGDSLRQWNGRVDANQYTEAGPNGKGIGVEWGWEGTAPKILQDTAGVFKYTATATHTDKTVAKSDPKVTIIVKPKQPTIETDLTGKSNQENVPVTVSVGGGVKDGSIVTLYGPDGTTVIGTGTVTNGKATAIITGKVPVGNITAKTTVQTPGEDNVVSEPSPIKEATNIVPTAKTQTVGLNEKPNAKNSIGNNGDLPNGTNYTWKTTPDTSTSGDKPGVVTVTYPDGSTIDVPVTVKVTQVSDDYTPKYKDGSGKPGSSVDIPVSEANGKKIPDGTTFESGTPGITVDKDGKVTVTIPKDKNPGEEVTGKVLVRYPDGSEEEVPVKVTVTNQDKDDYTPKYEDGSGKPGSSVDIPVSEANGKKIPDGTTFESGTPGITVDKDGKVTVTIPKDKNPGEEVTGKVLVRYPDGSEEEVPVKVTVTNRDKDDYTPKYNDGSGKPGSSVDIPVSEANGKKIPDGTTFESGTPGITVDKDGKVTVTIPKDKNPGEEVTGKVLVRYPDGSEEEVPVKVTVTNQDKDVYTPKYEDGNGKPGSSVDIPVSEANGKKIPDGTTFESGTPGITVDKDGKVTVTIPKDKNPGEEVTGKVLVRYPDGSEEEVPVKVTVTNRDKDDYTPKYNDGSGKPGSSVDIPVSEANGKKIPDGTTFESGTPGITVDKDGKVTVTIPKDKNPGEEVTGKVLVRYPDGSEEEVPVKVTVTNRDKDDYTPKYNDGSGKPGSSVDIPVSEANGKKIPDGTTFESGTPGITVDKDGKVTVTIPKDKNPGEEVTGKVLVRYPDGSEEEVPVKVTVTNRDKDDYTPKYNDGSGKPGSSVDIPVSEANGKKIPDGTTFESGTPGITVDKDGKVTVTIPKDKNPGEEVTGKVLVRYPDGSEEEVPVKVTVTNRDKDDYTPKYNDGSGKPGSSVDIPVSEANGKKIPDGTTFESGTPGITVDKDGKVTVTIPKDKNPGEEVTGKVLVRYPDGSEEEVPVKVTVTNQDKDVYTPKYEDGNGKPGSSVDIPVSEANGKKIPDGTTFESGTPGITVDKDGKVTVTIPKDKNPGEEVTGKVLVRYPDGSEEEVPVKVTVTNRDKDDYTPKYEDGNGKPGSSVDIPVSEANGKKIPDGTTFESGTPGITVDKDGKVTVTIPKDKNPGEEVTGKVLVRYPDGSEEEVPVKVTVTPPEKLTPTLDVEQDPKTGDVTVTPKKPDGSGFKPGTKVEIPSKDKDGNPTTITVTIGEDGKGKVPNSELPEGKVPGTAKITEPGQPTVEVPVETPAKVTPETPTTEKPVAIEITRKPNGDAVVTPKKPDGSTYPSGSKVVIPGENNTPIEVTIGDNGSGEVPNDKLPKKDVPGTGTVTEPNKKPSQPVDVTTPAQNTPTLDVEQDPKTGDVTVTPKKPDGSGFKPGTKVEIPSKDKDGNPTTITVTIGEDGKGKVPNSELPEGKVPGTAKITEPGQPTVEVPVETPAKVTPETPTTEKPVAIEITRKPNGDAVVTPKKPDGSTYPPGTKVEIPGENGTTITVTIGDNGSGEVPNDKLPKGNVPGKGTVTEPNKKPSQPVDVTTPARKTPTLDVERDPKTGDVTVTPKKPDGSTYPPGTTVEIPGENGPITITIGEDGKGKVPNDNLPKKDVPGTAKITEPGKPTVEVPNVTTPGKFTPETPTTEQPGEIEITRKPNGDAVVTPKKPDGSTYPPGTKVEIPGENGTTITVTIGDNGSGEVPNDKLPKGNVPGKGTVTEPNKKPSQPVDVTTPARKTPTLDVERDPKTGDVTVTPKKPDGSTYPPGTTVEIPGENGPITITIGEDGKGKVPNDNLPKKDVPGTAKITEPGKPTVEVPNVTTPGKFTPETPTTEQPVAIEITRKPNGDAVVTPKKPDGSTYPPGTKVEIPGENGTTITVTIGDNGSGEVPNDKLPKGNVPGKGTVTEPNKKPSQPVDVTTPARKTPTLDVERDPKTGDVTVTPKKPDGSTYPPGTTVEIPGENGPITITIGEDGKGKVPNDNLPKKDVPGTAKITEPGKPTVEVPNVTTPGKFTPETPTTEQPGEIEITRKPNGDAIVTPKKPDGSTYPPGTKVEIPGENGTTITVTIGDNGSGEVPNDKLPKGNVPGKGTVTEPNKKPSQPVDVTTPARKTPTLDVERDPKTGDVTVTPKKPDGSTYPPGTTVEIPGENGPITITIGEDGKGKVPNDNLPKKDVPGTAKITEPGKPTVEVPNVTTPGKFTPETPTTEQPVAIEITRKPNGDAVVTPKKPDGSTYPPGTKVEIPGENGTTITVTIGDNGSGEVPNDKLPKGNVPGKGTVTEPNKKPSQPVDVTTPARKTPTLDVERDPKTGDVTVTPKKPDGSTYPPGTTVEIPGENGPITITIGEDGKGKVPNDNLPKKDVPGTAKITEPGKPTVEVPNVTTPGKFTPETPTTEQPGEIEITRKPNGDAIVTPKKPDGSTYPPGTKVEIPGENGTTITVTIGDNGSGEVPNDKLPKGNVPGKGTVTEPNKKPSQPVDVTTPARKTPTLDVERDPKTGDVTVTPKKPDGSTYPPGTTVEIPGENGPITITIGEDGKGKVPNDNLPKKDVPGTAKITEPGKPTVEVPNVTTPGKFTPETPTTEQPGEIEITRKPNGDAVVTPKKPDGSTYPPGTKVEIPGENGTTITVTIGDNGSGEVPNDKLPKGNVPGKGTVTEPNKKPSQPVDVTTPARKTPTIDVERDPKTGDVTVTPKKPDGSTYPPGTKVEIPGKDGNTITVTIDEEGKGKVPNSELPEGKVPGTAKITEPGKSTVEVPVITPAKVTSGKVTPDEIKKETKRLANTGTTETNTGLAGLGLGILGGLLAAARRRKNDKN